MKVQEKKKRVVVLCLRPPENVRLGSFTSVHVVTTAKKCSKKRDARVMLLFCILNLLLFCLSRFRHRRRCLLGSLQRNLPRR